MNASRPLTLQQEQARIDAARDFYLSRGGQVQVLASYEFKPIPPRNHPAPPEKPESSDEAKAEREAMLRELAKTMTYAQAKEKTGLSVSTLHRAAMAGGFQFQLNVQHRGRAPDPEGDAKKCERLIALRDIGLTRHQVAKQMGIGRSQFERLIDQYYIDFPSKGTA
jgi:predicted DNA-binding protein (UPF0251 family)